MPIALCLNSNTYHGFGLDDAIEGAARAGIQLIELSAVAGYTEHVMPDIGDAALTSLLAQLADQRIRPVALGGHSNLTTSEGRAQLLSNITLGKRIGVDYLVSGTGETHGDEQPIQDAREFANELSPVVQAASDAGIRLAIETHGVNYPTGQHLINLVQTLGSETVGICYDTGNTIFYGGVDPYDDLASSLPHLVGMHLKDKAGLAEEWNFPAIGEGDTDFARVLEILQADGGKRTIPLSIEVEFTPDGPADVDEVHRAVQTSVATLRALGYENVAQP